MNDPADSASESGTSHDTRNSIQRFLFPIDGEGAADLIPLVCDIVTDADGELHLIAPVTVPEQTPLSMPQPREQAEHELARFILELKQRCDETPQISRVLKVGRNRGHILKTIVEGHHIDTIITDDQPRTGIRALLGLEAVDEEAIGEDCNTLIVTRTDYPDDFESVLVPIARGPHSGLAIDTGLALARQNDASLELLHVYERGDDEGEQEGRDVLERGRDRVGAFEPIETTLREAEEVPAAVIGAAQLFEVVVLGAPREGLIQQFVLGTIPDSVSTSTEGTVVIAHRGGTEDTWHARWL